MFNQWIEQIQHAQAAINKELKKEKKEDPFDIEHLIPPERVKTVKKPKEQPKKAPKPAPEPTTKVIVQEKAPKAAPVPSIKTPPKPVIQRKTVAAQVNAVTSEKKETNKGTVVVASKKQVKKAKGKIATPHLYKDKKNLRASIKKREDDIAKQINSGKGFQV